MNAPPGTRGLGLAAVVVVLVTACDYGTTEPRDSAGPNPPSPFLSTISDTDSGAPVRGFWVLPPLVDETPDIAEDFNPDLPVAIDICELDVGRSCVAPVRTFTPDQVEVVDDGSGEQYYRAIWHTGNDALDTEVDYRVTWRVDDEVLGFRDVNPDEGGSASDPDAHVFNNGRTLPLKVFVGVSALCDAEALSCGTGTIDLSEGGVIVVKDLENGSTTGGLEIPPQSITTGTVTFVAQELPLGPDECLGPNMDAVVFSPCLDITTTSNVINPGNTLSEPAIVSICIDEAAIQVLRGLTEDGVHRLQIAKFHEEPAPGFVQVLPNAAEVVCSSPAPSSGQALSGSPVLRLAQRGLRFLGDLVGPQPLQAVDLGVGGLDPMSGLFSRYAFHQPGTLAIARGNNQAAPVGTALSVDPTVVALATDGLPYPDAGVHFHPPSGGSIAPTPADLITDADGEAGVQWTLPATPGTYTLRAYSLGLYEGGLPDHHGPDSFIPDLQPAVVEFTAYACVEGEGFGPPVTVDGVFDAVEWACAQSTTFDANVSGGSVRAELYWQNDGTSIYFAVRIPRPETDKDNGLRIDFDNTLDGPTADDDAVAFDPEDGIFRDQFLGQRCLQRGQSGCGESDAANGGTVDGSGAFAHDGTYSVYELAHPLNSGDVRDLAVGQGESFGVVLSLTLGKGAQGNTQWPGFRVYQHITVAAPVG